MVLVGLVALAAGAFLTAAAFFAVATFLAGVAFFGGRGLLRGGPSSRRRLLAGGGRRDRSRPPGRGRLLRPRRSSWPAPSSARSPPWRRRSASVWRRLAPSAETFAGLAGAGAFFGRLPFISASTVSSLGAPATSRSRGAPSSMPRRGASTACTTNVRVSSLRRARRARGWAAGRPSRRAARSSARRRRSTNAPCDANASTVPVDLGAEPVVDDELQERRRLVHRFGLGLVSPARRRRCRRVRPAAGGAARSGRLSASAVASAIAFCTFFVGLVAPAWPSAPSCG